MPNYCTQCGAALNAGARFCSRCGDPVVEASAAASAPHPAPAQQTAVPPAPGVGKAAPKNTSAVKVILIVLGVFIGLGILAGAAVTFGIWGLSRAVHVDSGGKNVSIATPMGNMSMGETQVTEAELGVPIYPGATGEQGNFRIGTAKGSLGTFAFRTPDDPKKVMEFYRSRLGQTVDVVTTPQGGVITSAPSAKEDFMITIGRDESDGTTLISVIRGIAPQ